MASGRTWLAWALAVLLVLAVVTSVLDAGPDPQLPAMSTTRGSRPPDVVASIGGHRLRPSPSPAGVPGQDGPEYARLLRDPASLGFVPDVDLLGKIRSHLGERFVHPVSDAQLFEGVAREVGRLLKGCGLPADRLAGVARDRSMPATILALYGGRVDRGVLCYAMIRGLLGATGDPHTVLMTPEQAQRLAERVDGEDFAGIGVALEVDGEGRLTVLEALDGTPAQAAGLLPGDRILRIDRTCTEGLDSDRATSAIRGPAGSEVFLAVRSEGSDAVREVSIRRARVEVPTVTRRMLSGRVGLIRVRAFGSRTGSDLAEALSGLEAEGARGLVLDLRGNRGGYLDAAIDVCSHFVGPGAVISRMVARGGVVRERRAPAQRRQTKLPVVLLVNEHSASASEIIAGCLKDYGTATLLGTRTLGKGSVQELLALLGGGSLKITVAEFRTPLGHAIDGSGVVPDVTVGMDPVLAGRAQGDVQLARSLALLKARQVTFEAGRPMTFHTRPVRT